MPKIQARSLQNRRKIDLGSSWATKAASGTRLDTLGTGFGRQNDAPRRILGRPARAKSGQEPSERIPEPPRRRSKTLPVSRPNACGAPTIVERVFGSIFFCFCLVARKLRCASRTSFYRVMVALNAVDRKRVGTPETVENRGASASKFVSGTVRTTQNRA